jgi:phytoene synthase
MADSPSLRASQEACRAMTRHHAKTFYFASHVLPRQKRRDAYAVYAFCRYVDDRIDLTTNEEVQHRAFEYLHTLLESAYHSAPLDARELPWFPAFRDTIHRREIPQSYFEDLLTGVQMDCGPVRMESWPGLERYCYHVASVVGLMMVHVLAKPTPDLLKPAGHLGTAMQLTNILRDIGEDWNRDRLYLPSRELAKFGLNAEDIALRRGGDSFRALMRFQIGRARAYYSLAQPGIAALPRDGSQLTVRLMSAIYAGILDEIEHVDYQVYGRRVRVSFARKLWIALKA